MGRLGERQLFLLAVTQKWLVKNLASVTAGNFERGVGTAGIEQDDLVRPFDTFQARSKGARIIVSGDESGEFFHENNDAVLFAIRQNYNTGQGGLLKILHLIASTGVGGAERHLLDLCQQQQAAGLQISVALPATGALGAALQEHGIAWNLIRAGGRWNPLALYSLRKLVRRIQPDLIHAHMLKSASMAGYADRSVPCVATAHNIAKHLAPFRHCRHVICVSDSVQESLCRLGYPQSRTTVVYNAVDTRDFSVDNREKLRQQLDWQNQLVVLVVARLVPAKGQQFAIEALAQWLPQLGNVRLVLAGAGPDREKLVQLADKLGVATHLSLLGERNDVPDLLAAADIYLQPSMKEGFCIAFLEAMATGLPCIGTRTGAIPNMIEPGVNGLLIEPGDVQAIADAVLSIATDADRRRDFSSAAIVTAQTRFSLKKQADDTQQVYRNALTGK